MHQLQSLNLASLLDFIGFLEVRQCKIYYCTGVKLGLFRVYIESLTMSSQESLKKKSKQDNISLPPCLATGIRSLAPRATSGQKSREASFGTTLWHHIQKYCCFGILLAHAQIP